MTTPAEQEVTNLNRIVRDAGIAREQLSGIFQCPATWEYIIAAATHAAEGQAAAWDEAIKLVKGLLPELERVNKVELEHGFIGTSYELGQTKDIIELLEAARDASPPTAPHEPQRCAECEHSNLPNADGSCSGIGFNGVDCSPQPCTCRHHVLCATAGRRMK